MKAPNEFFSDHNAIASPFASIFVALGGAVVVAGAMLVVGFSDDLRLASYVPDFAVLQSMIIG
ncbi:hypothetical protein [Hyphomicrobium sp. D-2]|uniref:hypothetical protein n=1 Tax=Hyphomicrobium sp. D-2 TaxID=3041621 RepID=UPI0024562C3D|nr:hypothetical protein [Hyphomicrobium sp. D-2]MDH4982063.1 hypothetical protein [Hyphomicrobium sp. D-2]